MTQPLPLIDKIDNFELITSEIAAILKTEAAAQLALAIAAGKPDPTLFDLRVFQDRSNPWEEFPSKTTDETPLANVYFDATNFIAGGSTTMDVQKSASTFNIDLYGYGVSADNPAGGHTPGDAAAIQAVKRAIRITRNILMSSKYSYLGLRGLVGYRRVASITAFQPQQDADNAQHIAGARIAFLVDFNEFSPQYEPTTLELVSGQVKLAENNEVVIVADYDYTT